MRTQKSVPLFAVVGHLLKILMLKILDWWNAGTRVEGKCLCTYKIGHYVFALLIAL